LRTEFDVLDVARCSPEVKILFEKVDNDQKGKAPLMAEGPRIAAIWKSQKGETLSKQHVWRSGDDHRDKVMVDETCSLQCHDFLRDTENWTLAYNHAVCPSEIFDTSWNSSLS
jgi:hypothetical protein